MAKVAVMGAGSWGTALAMVIARNGHRAMLWGRDAGAISRMRADRQNERYLPDLPFPSSLEPVENLRECLAGASLALVAVPSHAFAGHLDRMREQLDSLDEDGPRDVLWATKGFDAVSGGLLHETAQAHLGDDFGLGVLSGPSFAREVAIGLPTAVTLASRNSDFASRCAAVVHAPSFRVYTTDDVVGVQIGGAVKNALAIAAGVVDGLGFGANARAALVTRGLAELTRLGVAMGGRESTFSGLAGLGDLMLTCTDDQSRNRRFGLMLAKGAGMEQAVADIGQVVEGAAACRVICELAERMGVDMPICQHVHQVLFEGQSPIDAVQSLLARQQKPES